MNTTDSTFAIVDAVDDLNTLSLRADVRAGSSSANVFVSGEGYNIYIQYELSDSYAELNGQTISDSDSPWNSKTIPDDNGDVRFFYGGNSSGSTKAEDYLPSHTHTVTTESQYGSSGASSKQFTTDSKGAGTAWAGKQIVWIMRIK